MWPLVRVVVVGIGIAATIAGGCSLRIDDWPIYLTYLGLGLALNRFSVEVLPTLRMPLPELALTIGFLYIAGPAVLVLVNFLPSILFQLLSWLSPPPARRRLQLFLGRHPWLAREVRHAMSPGVVVPPSVIAADWSAVPIGLGARWLGAIAVAGGASPVDDPIAIVAGEVVGYATWTLLSSLPILSFNWRGLMVRTCPRETTPFPEGLQRLQLRQDLGLIMIPTLTPFVFLIAYGYRTQGLAAAAVWSVASLGVHFLLERLTERRVVVEQQNLQLAELNRELEHRERLSAIGKMSSVVSHQTLQHLGVIGLHADLIRNLELAGAGEESDGLEAVLARAQDSASAIETALAEVNQVLTDLLVFSRDLRLNLYEQSAQRLIAECVADCAAEASAAGATLGVVVPEREVSVAVDKLKLKQALTNLIRNAIEVSPSGGEVTIAATLLEAELEIAVSDHGPGVPAGDREAVFLPFYTTKERGTGLGLAIAREFTVAHGGRLWVEARDGGAGSRFVLCLPLTRAGA